jgi:hypothetical protein
MVRKEPTPASNNTFQSNSTTTSICITSNVAVQLLPYIPRYNFHSLNLVKCKCHIQRIERLKFK